MTSGNLTPITLIAFAELQLQFPQIKEKIIGFIEFGGESGVLVAMLISSFLSYLIGYIGPFSFCGNYLNGLINQGGMFLIGAIFQDKLMYFMPKP